MKKETSLVKPADQTPDPILQELEKPHEYKDLATRPLTTPAQAKVDAIANLTMAAYQKAGTLNLTSEESRTLQQDFPDDAFQPGAAGKENLIYIEHAHLRDRLTQVFGMGQWALICRNRWAEPFRTQKGTDGQRVYVEAMLVIRGCFVAEAVGAMEYYPKNESQNYADAVEGATTAALRRCAKQFGVGLQAWKKEWVDGWWKRKQQGKRPLEKPDPHLPSQQKRETKPERPEKPKMATEATRNWMLENLKATPDGDNHALVREYFTAINALLPNEQLEDLSLEEVPISKAELGLLSARIGAFSAGDPAERAYPRHEAPAKTTPKSKAKEPEDAEAYRALENDDLWRSFEMPFGKHAGTPLEDLDKKYLYGLWANFEVETEYNGRAKKPETIAKDRKFREMLDAAGQHYDFTTD